MANLKELVKREKHAVITGQSPRFRLVKYAVLLPLVAAIIAWKGWMAALWLILFLCFVSVCIHFLFRWKSNGWRKSWWLYKHVPFEAEFAHDTDAPVTFTPLQQSDLHQLHTWLNTDHVRIRWGNKNISYEEVSEKYLPLIQGIEPSIGYIINYYSQQIGFIQTYKIDSYPEYKAQIGIEENAAGLDLFIGNPDCIGKGIGTKAIKKFVQEVVFATYDVVSCIVDPALNNPASIQALKNAGFVYVKNILDPDTGEKQALFRLGRL